MFIIQTNRNNIDFQSYMYEIKKQNWEEFKEYIVSSEDFTSKIVNSTLSNKPSRTKTDKKVIRVNINDDHHLEVVFEDNVISSYMKVECQ